MDFEKRLSQAILLGRLVSGAMLATLGVYLALVELQLKYTFHEPLIPLYRELRIALAILALVMVVVSRKLLPKMMGRYFLAKIGAAQNEAIKLTCLFMVRTEHVLQAAVYEGIGTFGLILFILGGGNPYDLYGFVAVAALLILVQFPQANAWRERVEQLSSTQIMNYSTR